MEVKGKVLELSSTGGDITEALEATRKIKKMFEAGEIESVVVKINPSVSKSHHPNQ